MFGTLKLQATVCDPSRIVLPSGTHSIAMRLIQFASKTPDGLLVVEAVDDLFDLCVRQKLTRLKQHHL